MSTISLFWRQAEAGPDLAACLRSALIASTIGTLAERTVPELLAGLVEIGACGKRWPPALAVSYIETMGDPHMRARAIAQLAPLLVDAEMPFDRLLEIAGRIDIPHASGFAIRALVPRISGALVATAYFTAATLPEPARGETLVTLIPRVPDELVRHATGLLKTEGFGSWTAEIVVELLNRGADIAPCTWLGRLKVEHRVTVIRVLVERGIDWDEVSPYAGDLDPSDLARVLALVVTRDPEVGQAQTLHACAAVGDRRRCFRPTRLQVRCAHASAPDCENSRLERSRRARRACHRGLARGPLTAHFGAPAHTLTLGSQARSAGTPAGGT